MRNELTVALFEIRSLLGKPSFWLLTLLFPAFVLVLSLGGQLLIGNDFGDAGAILAEEEVTGLPEAVGYVDQAGLIHTLPPELPADLVHGFPNEGAAQAAMAAGEISRYLIVAPDFIESGNLVLVQQNFQPLGDTDDGLIRYIINYNLIGDADLTFLVTNPLMSVITRPLMPVEVAAGDPAAGDPALEFILPIVPIAAAMVLFFVLVMSSSYMLRSVTREKENRTVEVLLLSLRPRQLMLGKILGLSVVALVQMTLWLGAGMLVLSRDNPFFQLAGSLQLPAGFVAWSLAYVLLGYLLYAALMGALGALAPDSREANQFSFIVLLPLMIPLWFNYILVNTPNGTAAVVLSLFPLTAPPAMIARMAATDVPLWQPLLGIGLLALTTYGAILLSARFFSAGTLLSTASMNWRHVWRGVRGEA
jgi:ABC-2 type transport system permease protein